MDANKWEIDDNILFLICFALVMRFTCLFIALKAPKVKEKSGSLVSLGSKKVLQVTIGRKLTALSGISVKLLCPADGLPLPDVYWKKDGSNITFESGKLEQERTSLLIRNISKKDEGDYICVAYNNAGRDVGKTSVRVIRKFNDIFNNFNFVVHYF